MCAVITRKRMRQLSSVFQVKMLTPEQFRQRRLPDFQALIYAQYRAADVTCIRQEAKQDHRVPSISRSNGIETYYFVAVNSQPDILCKSNAPKLAARLNSEQLDQLFTGPFSQIAGFYRIEVGQIDTSQEACIGIEAAALMQSDLWDQDGQWVAEISSLTPHPGLSSRDKAQVTRQIHQQGSKFLKERYRDEDPQMIAIMAPHVRSFVQRLCQVNTSQIDGIPLWRDPATHRLTDAAESVFARYPGYWGSESDHQKRQPKLWRIQPSVEPAKNRNLLNGASHMMGSNVMVNPITYWSQANTVSASA